MAQHSTIIQYYSYTVFCDSTSIHKLCYWRRTLLVSAEWR